MLPVPLANVLLITEPPLYPFHLAKLCKLLEEVRPKSNQIGGLRE